MAGIISVGAALLAVVRVGVVGLDTSHSVAFTRHLNVTREKPEYREFEVVAAVARGSRDIVSATNRIPAYTAQMREMGVEIVPDVAALLGRVDAVLLETADSLSKRFNQSLGLIRSWGKVDETKNFLVIPDNMMNLELLEWAARAKGGAPRFHEIAVSHANVTMRNHFRADGGTYHVLNYSQADGRVQEIRRGQGASCFTAWSRGQSWAIYGFTMMHRETRDADYLGFAQTLADFAMNHANMPEDGIPFWDYGAPGEERDSSAGAIMASALLELADLVPVEKRASYRDFAVKQLATLASPEYFSAGDENGHWLLKHGVGAKPMNSEIDTPLNYGDYYFLEALLRFRNSLKK